MNERRIAGHKGWAVVAIAAAFMGVTALAAHGQSLLPTPPGHQAASTAPDGYVVMSVLGVIPTEGGGTVMLVDPSRSMVVPIGVGGSEALTIALRQEQQGFERPLTHDLLDSMLVALDATLAEVRVEAIHTHVYVASITIQQGEIAHRLDARASDAIAMALGHGIPIWFSQAVVQEGGIPIDEFMDPPDAMPRVPRDGPLVPPPGAVSG